jgi:hypothetical protein
VKLTTPLFLAFSLLAGCAKNTALPTAKLASPFGVAAFRGYNLESPGLLRHMVAVSNSRGDDLKIIDAVTDRVVLAPAVVGALSVPTLPRPSLVAAGRLHDVGADLQPLALPDLLVVAPRGLLARASSPGRFAAFVQLVQTWNPSTRIMAAIDLGDVAPEAVITALTVIPVPMPDGTATPGQARLVIAMSDGGLVTIDAARVAGSEAIALGDPARLDLGMIRQDLGFTPLDLAASDDGLKVYVATTDPIPGPGGILGVAELEVTAPRGAWPVRALSARIGTTRVVAIGVAPFVDNDQAAAVPDVDLFGPIVPRVYAVLDSGACGRDRSIVCGLAVIDPVTGTLAADPAGEMPYQVPMELEGEAVAMAASGPPLHSQRAGYQQVGTQSGTRWTQAMAAITTTTGRVFLADLSHFAMANDLSPLVGTGSAHTQGATSVIPALNSNAVGIWLETDNTTPTPTWDVATDATMVLGVAVTPGYIGSERWAVTYQGILPGLSQRLAQARVPGGTAQAPTRIAIQEANLLTGPGTDPWRGVVRVYDPRLAIQPNDVVVVTGLPSGTCPLGDFEMVVSALLPPSADAPGGSLALVEPAVQPTNPGQSSPADAKCLPAGADTQVTVTVHSGDFVLVGSGTGYAGRPQESVNPRATPPFEFKYQDEDLLACPIMPDSPSDWPPPPAAVAACEADVATCRATCEALVLARRARRKYYVTERCSDREEICYAKWTNPPYNLAFPMPKGPTIGFRLGVKRNNGGFAPPARGSYASFYSSSGMSPSVRVPYSGANAFGATLPGEVLLFDRSEATGLETDGIRGFAAFTQNLVLDFSPSVLSQNATTIR